MKDTDSDSWQPSATLNVLRLRASIYQKIRRFFASRDVLEVETPILSFSAATDPHLESLSTRLGPDSHQLFLQTSPEFPMKRLLASASGAIYQICKVFRADESGRLHNPEFSMLEWYRPGYLYKELMQEVTELFHELLPERYSESPVEMLTYEQAFEKYAGISSVHEIDQQNLVDMLQRKNNNHSLPALQSRDECLDFVMATVISPQLGIDRITFVYDFPASQASLAQVRHGSVDVAERFECFIAGMEIANGFQELTNAKEQRLRFERELGQRKKNRQQFGKIDEKLIAALSAGLPESSGVAVGLDRLIMAICNADHIHQVLAFPVNRA